MRGCQKGSRSQERNGQVFSLAIVVATSACAAAPAAKAPPIRSVYVLPMSHLDIGFTDVPSAVAAKMAAMTDQALDQAAADPDYIWNSETFWQLDQWLAKKPSPERQKQLADLVRSGRFSVGAAYVTPHSWLMSEWMLARLFEPAQTWAKRAGVTLESAVLNDVPGHPPDLPRALARAGVKYLVLGTNTLLTPPLAEKFCNKPFWWEAPTGERVLTWISSDSYIEAFTQMGFDPDSARFFAADKFQGDAMTIMRKGIGGIVSRFAAKAYPYDAILSIHAFDNWGAGASLKIPRFARQWNEAGEGPKIKPATPKMFFEHILAEAQGPLPVYRGGFGGTWDRNKISLPMTIRRMRSAEAAFRKEGLDCRDPRVLALLTFYEHSFPLATGWPGELTEEQVRHHNREQAESVRAIQGDERGWPVRGRPTPLNVKGDGKLVPNGLYIADGPAYGQFVNHEPKPPEPGAWTALDPRRTADGVWQLRHRIDRTKVPHAKLLVWAWPLRGSAKGLRPEAQTASGWMRIPEDLLDGQARNNWFSPWATRVDGVEIEADIPLAFCVWPERYPKWLFAMCFSQSLDAVFKGGGKRSLTVQEAYPTEEPVFEFTIEIRPIRAQR